MGSFSKKIVGKINPIKGLILGKDKKKTNVPYLTGIGETREREASLASAMKEYDEIPGMLRSGYLDTAKRAGTFGATPEFEAGLNSEVEAGARGARVSTAARINSLKKALGHTDVFNPEGVGQTQSNLTEDQLRNAPTSAEGADAAPTEGTATPAETSAAPMAANPVSKVSAPLQKKFSPFKRVASASGRTGALRRFGSRPTGTASIKPTV